MKDNTLLDTLRESGDSGLFFSQISNQDFSKAFSRAIEEAKKCVKTIENQNEAPNFKNTIEALEVSSQELDQVSSLFFNLYHACGDETLEEIAPSLSAQLAQYSNDKLLSRKLFQRVQSVYENSCEELNPEEKKLLEETHRTFIQNGANLSLKDQKKLRQWDQELALACPRYSNNLLKAIQGFHLNVKNREDLEGMPSTDLSRAQEQARKQDQKGWTFTLQAPSFAPFMKYVNHRELRKKMWIAYHSKALEGPYSNKQLCKDIASLRHQRAQLLGFDSHAHLTLSHRMAKDPQRVFQFLESLKEVALKVAQKELKNLQDFAQEHWGLKSPLQPWDVSFYSEKYRKHLFHISEKEIRAYFPLKGVLKGLFIHGEKLYGLQFEKQKNLEVYHPDVEVYKVNDSRGYLGLLYFDLLSRDNKKSGAWMTHFKLQGFNGKKVQRPHVSIVCNFPRPVGENPSLLNFEEVKTLFHEFGHALHGLLSQCYYTSLSGTNVLWDFVELPSQIMENWAYEKESLQLFAKHYKTQEVLPEDWVHKLKQARSFQSGYMTLRQISFAFLDMAWHHDIKDIFPQELGPVELENKVFAPLRLLPHVEGTNLSVGFSHIFDGGYSAGYYSYKWAEVLDADAFELFQEEGIFNRSIASRFRDCILAQGGSRDPDKLYEKFRNRPPNPQALLRRSGLL